MSEPILVLNCGSSSIKFALFDAGLRPLARKALWSGSVDGIGKDKPYPAALQEVRERVVKQTGGQPPEAIVHRVVHGGAKYAAPARVDAAVLADLKSYIPLAPLHQPFALHAIELLLAELPQMPQVACFDTAFHRTVPQVEQMLPLPQALRQRGVRRYGFHGLSYEYMSVALPERHGNAARGRTIVAHLGSGASLCAMQELRSVATTMGFSALEGLMMGTRCGSLDPGVLLYLLEIEKLSLGELTNVLYRQSGLLGASSLSPSAQVLLEAEATNREARAALELWVRRVVREIGALTAVLGGLDMLAFTAGIGEHSAVLRERICAAFGWLGLELDASANAANASIISTARSRVRVAVEPTNEEWIAASHAVRVLSTDMAEAPRP
ncbi:MAG TPA: acetate/propionate family kinase [Burkholderiales bacterium]|nr:acetate/propionate family kinase [Burkholderiales bacterium]